MSVRGQDTVLIGHPFAPIGMGEHVRCAYRAFRAVGFMPRLVDVYGLNEPEPAMLAEMQAALSREPGRVNVCHLNGDELQQALAHVPLPEDAYNIVYPAWELSRYPEEWARQLERFDEVWAPSRFIQESIGPAVARPVIHMPLACEVRLSSFLGRRYFRIPEAAYVFLFFLDLRSYASRKNPEAVIECFKRLVARRPFGPAFLVLKVNGAGRVEGDAERLNDLVAEAGGSGMVIAGTMTDNEIKNLVRCADCFVSLHRSEGFGRGLSEAMYLGKPVIATGYSGNLDFMTPENSLLVGYRMVPVPEGAYPFWHGQVWADPDLEQAVDYMVRLIDDPRYGVDLGRRASATIRTMFSYRAVGLRYVERLSAISEIARGRNAVPLAR